jgi:hypothetical protein
MTSAPPVQTVRTARCRLDGRLSLRIARTLSSERTDIITLHAHADPDFEQQHMFKTWCNWVLPGFLAVGQYPFIDPHHTCTRDQGEARLKDALSAGLATFVCLQQELPPQGEMPARGVGGFQPYKATADLIAASARPAASSACLACSVHAHYHCPWVHANLVGSPPAVQIEHVQLTCVPEPCTTHIHCCCCALGKILDKRTRAAGMSGPPPGEVVEGLRNPYLDQFVPPRRKAASASYSSWQPLRPRYAHHPIEDLSVPTEECLLAAVDDVAARLKDGTLPAAACPLIQSAGSSCSACWIRCHCMRHSSHAVNASNLDYRSLMRAFGSNSGAWYAGEKLYVHCWGGRGRSNMVAAALLAKLYGCTGDEALARVQAAYCTRGADEAHPRVPETDAQVEFMRAVADKLAAAR